MLVTIFNVTSTGFFVPRDLAAVVTEVSQALEIPQDEARLYGKAISTGKLTPGDARTEGLARSLFARGMLIVDASGKSYLPVHPRMALSNLFRAYEERAIRERKEKRLLVDRLTLELITMIPGETKGTNASGPRGRRTAKD